MLTKTKTEEEKLLVFVWKKSIAFRRRRQSFLGTKYLEDFIFYKIVVISYWDLSPFLKVSAPYFISIWAVNL